MRRDLGNLAMAVLVFGVGGLALFGASRHAYYTEFGPDAGFFPFWVGLAQAFFGLALVFHVWRQGHRPPREEQSVRWRQLVVSVCLVAYLLLMQALGFIIATAAFFLVTLGVVERRSWRDAALASFGLTAALFGLFGWAFSIPLPQGPFGDY